MEKLKLATKIQMGGQLKIPGKDHTVCIESQARYHKQHRPGQKKTKQQLFPASLWGRAGVQLKSETINNVGAKARRLLK